MRARITARNLRSPLLFEPLCSLFAEPQSVKFIRKMSLLVLLLLFGSLSGWACDPQNLGQFKQLNTTPSTWKTVPGYSKILARSFPDETWLSLLLTLPNTAEKIFSVSIPSQIRGHSSSQRALRLLLPKRKKQKKIDGLTLYFQTSHDLSLSVRLNILNSLDMPVAFAQTLDIKKASKPWRRIRILFRDFQKVQPSTQTPFELHRISGELEFWSLPSKTKKDNKTITLTLRTPSLFSHKKQSKTSARPTTRPSTRSKSQPTTRAHSPTTRPSTRPTSQPTTRAHSHPTTRPSRRN